MAEFMLYVLLTTKDNRAHNFIRRLLSHVGAGAKTGLTVSHSKSMHPKVLNLIGSLLRPVTESYNALC
jgi:hypothetical protein